MALFECTVPTGFEGLACEEVKQTLNVEAIKSRGRILITLPVNLSHKVLELRSVECVYCVVLSLDDVPLNVEDSETALTTLYKLVPQVDWLTALSVWQIAFHAKWKGDIPKTVEQLTVQPRVLVANPEKDIQVPTFRVTCYRNGKHSFPSMPAAKEVGSEIFRRTKWVVKMKQYDINVVVRIHGNKVTFSILLTPDGSLHKRNVTFFGPTNLKSTLCNGLLRLARLKPGMVLCDPLCGGGSVALEAALAFPGLIVLAGDIHPVAVDRANQNVNAIRDNQVHRFSVKEMSAMNSINVFQWDSTQLPLKDHSLDVIVTDLPFGYRLGNKGDNRKLYPGLLREWARVLKPGGRAVILTQDKRNLKNSLCALSNLWARHQSPYVNIGGLQANAFVLSTRKTSEIVQI